MIEHEPEWEIPQARPETAEARKLRISADRQRALARLEELQQSHFELKQKSFTSYILDQYGYSEEEVENTQLSKRQELAIRNIAQDLLLVEFYDSDGNLSDFAERFYPDIDPEDYKPIPKEWIATKQILERKLERETGELPREVGLIPNKQEDSLNEILDPVEKFVRKYGPEKIIALPFAISIYTTRLDIAYSGSFVEPYGGIFATRIVFVQREDPQFAGM